MKKAWFFILIFILLPSRILAEEVSLTLDEAMLIALRDNRDILLKTEDVKKAKAKIAEAQSGLLPTLNFTASRTYTRGYYQKDISQTTTQSTLKQYLYKGGKTINTIKQKEYEWEVSQSLLDKTKLETILNVQKAFYTLLLAEEFNQLNKSILENTKEYLNSIKERYKNGQASESDILAIEASLSSVSEAFEVSLNQVKVGETLLKNLLYLEEGITIKPIGEFTYEPIEVAYDAAFLKAIKMRPEIRQYEAQAKADQRAIAVAKADNRPNIYASWDYYSRSTTSLTFSPSKGWQDYNIVGITFTWPIFDGWATRAKVEQAMVDLRETQLTKEEAVKDIALELKNAYLALKDVITKIETSEAEIKVYADNLTSSQEKYTQGIISRLDTDDAHLKYAISLFNKNEAVYDYIIAKSSFEKAAGGL